MVLAIRQCAGWIRRRFRIALFLHVHYERVVSCWPRLFWKGAPCFECAEVQGPGSRNEDCRRQPPPTDYVTCRVVHLRCFYHTNEKNTNTKKPIHIYVLWLNLPSDNVQGIDHSEWKVDTIRWIPPISSNQLSFPAYTQLNTHYHPYPTIVPSMISSLCYTMLYLFAVRTTPHLHATPTPWEVTLPPPLSLLRPGGLAGRACICESGARSWLGWPPILSENGAPYRHRFWVRTPRLFLRRCSPPTSRWVRHLPFREVKKNSNERVTSLWLRSSKNTCPTRA